jgi:glyceraldehyde 3-phosphate dehydrogenase
MKRIAINGFGRIGRLTFRNLINQPNIEVVAINDLTNNQTLAHLLKYDTAHGVLPNNILGNESAIHFDDKIIKCFAIKNPLELPWKELNIDVVIECTGIFTDSEKALMHHTAGAKKVVISAPATGDVQTIVLGVNDEQINPDQIIFSNASCTTNCLAPVVKVLDQNFGFVQGFMSTAHAYTADQNLQDAPHKDLRRARAAAQNIVPTSTGAAEAVAKVYPSVKGKLTGKALRVPVITGSLVDLVCILEKEVTEAEINQAFKNSSETSMKGILEYNEAPIVSSDIVGNKSSSIFDAPLTKVMGKMVSVVAWYDNEAGYSARLAQLVTKVAAF